jgi:hypothetical protein
MEIKDRITVNLKYETHQDAKKIIDILQGKTHQHATEVLMLVSGVISDRAIIQPFSDQSQNVSL